MRSSLASSIATRLCSNSHPHCFPSPYWNLPVRSDSVVPLILLTALLVNIRRVVPMANGLKYSSPEEVVLPNGIRRPAPQTR